MKRRPNILIITLDSCRWDSFEAGAGALKKWGEFRCAFSQGTYTLPAHLSIYHGILPSTREKLPYFNRFEKGLFRLSGRKDKNARSLMTFEGTVGTIFDGFYKFGYETFGIGAVEWFRKPILTSVFSNFEYTGINLSKQIEILEGKFSGCGRPIAALLNVGETHDPYQFGTEVPPSLSSRARMRGDSGGGLLLDEMAKQVSACSWVADRLDELFKFLKTRSRPTLVVLCGDHGECFGEDGMHGHGFYHEKVMAVPLGIFCIGAKLEELEDIDCSVSDDADSRGSSDEQGADCGKTNR